LGARKFISNCWKNYYSSNTHVRHHVPYQCCVQSYGPLFQQADGVHMCLHQHWCQQIWQYKQSLGQPFLTFHPEIMSHHCKSKKHWVDDVGVRLLQESVNIQFSRIWKILMMVYGTQNFWGSGLCPSFDILKTKKKTMFLETDQFPKCCFSCFQNSRQWKPQKFWGIQFSTSQFILYIYYFQHLFRV
jgi:hypothetical protein